jgi:hypothetical protein
MLVVKIPFGHSFPFWMASGTDWRVWSSPPRLMKRFKAAVEPDASLTFTGCAAAEPDDGAALAHSCVNPGGGASDGATGNAVDLGGLAAAGLGVCFLPSGSWCPSRLYLLVQRGVRWLCCYG